MLLPGMRGVRRGSQLHLVVEEAREELFSHILRSGVIGAPPEQCCQWLDVTMHYLAPRYPNLSAETLDALRGRAERFISESR
jgi:hypothetical protein